MQLAEEFINRSTAQTDWIHTQEAAGRLTPAEVEGALIILWSNSWTGEYHAEYIMHALELIQRPDLIKRAQHDKINQPL